MRPPPLAAAAVLAAGSIWLTGSASSAASTCTPSVDLTRGAVTTLASGVTSTAYVATGGDGKVTFHLVRADLTASHLQLLSAGATGSAQVADLAGQQPGAVAAINGDLFHLATDSYSATPDGVEVSDGRLVKAGAGEADAFAVTDGRAGLIAPRFTGSVTITDAPAAANLQAATAGAATVKAAAVQKVRVPHQSPHEDYAPARPTPVHRSGTVEAAHPTAPAPVTVSVTPGKPGTPTNAPAPAQATVSLIGVNNTDGGGTSVLITSDWGSASVPASVDPTSTEYLIDDGVIVSALPATEAVRPPSGEYGLSLIPAVVNEIPWLAVGDPVSLSTSITATPPAVAIGGNAVLVSRGVADPGCTVGGDSTRRPRVAVGDADGGGTLVLAVSDGDQVSEPGLTPAEWAVALQKTGAIDALNLDGGQSATLLEPRGGSLAQVNVGQGDVDRDVPDGLAVVPN